MKTNGVTCNVFGHLCLTFCWRIPIIDNRILFIGTDLNATITEYRIRRHTNTQGRGECHDTDNWVRWRVRQPAFAKVVLINILENKWLINVSCDVKLIVDREVLKKACLPVRVYSLEWQKPMRDVEQLGPSNVEFHFLIQTWWVFFGFGFVNNRSLDWETMLWFVLWELEKGKRCCPFFSRDGTVLVCRLRDSDFEDCREELVEHPLKFCLRNIFFQIKISDLKK